MKAIVCESFGPLEELQFKDVADPQVKKGHVVVNVEAAGVNFPDGLLVQGLYQMQPDFPFIPGNEVAGTISEVGEGVSHLKEGQRVIALSNLGGYSEKALIPATHVMPLPDPIHVNEGAALVTAHATAHHALKQRAKLQPGETLVVTGAAGGTGLAAVQIGKIMGAKVIAVCSTEEKLALAKEYGADVLINYKEKDLKETLKEVTGGKGVDVVYECVGGDTFHACSRSMAWEGRLLVVGFAGGEIPKFPVNLALVKGYSVMGVFWGSFTQHDPKGFAENMQELLTWYVQGKVKVVVDEALPLEQATKAMAKVMNREVKGKMVLVP
ncbi:MULTISPECIES: NADPH:quinone oxidoreductase family protein [Alteromonas]|uniref:NADPH:quinone oxidoreductase family protein n=1 Tax=Alteromonas TaxID=226 RepID=UPI001275D039|nr:MULTISPECIES: NADPH:quinone oxidoreductase family protein [Alteromonas]MCS5576066.1 NADPH:quinone oxidoreductase family protein [Alteromonas macleodii]CAI2390336.1 NADPH:quinone reductase [Alteromonas macleodii]CAI3959777.1 NADPH:quinone reductase [Alteromonas macleodii]CAI3960664.1 NADPH:quinone reductase [Alteromonas macleodii]CAI3960670.1 NADPH:quinone reductase [Alteromonas macleodii]